MSKTYGRLISIKQSLEDITFILNQSDLKITQSIEAKILKPALRMHIIKIAEQFTKLKSDVEKILKTIDIT